MRTSFSGFRSCTGQSETSDGDRGVRVESVWDKQEIDLNGKSSRILQCTEG